MTDSDAEHDAPAHRRGLGRAAKIQNPKEVGWAGYFNGKVFASAGFTSSDARLKKEIANLSYGLKEALALRPVTFKWKDEARGQARQVGLIAQELQKVVPEVVDKDAASGMLSVNYPALVPVLLKALQDQQKILERQDARIASLEQGPIVSSLSFGGMNTTVVVGSLAAMLFMWMRRRRDQHPTR